MELHDRLKAAREDADLTQAQVAEQTGIARRQYIRYELGFDRQEGSAWSPSKSTSG